MSQIVRMVLISAIAGVVVASVVYALWEVVGTMSARSRARAKAKAQAAAETDNGEQSADRPE